MTTATAFKVRSNEKPSAAALREATRRWGKAAAVKQNKQPSNPVDREAAHAKNVAAGERIRAIDAEIEARLKALDWYQALQAERRELRKVRDEQSYWGCYHQFLVGHVSMGFFHVRGSGDSWEEAFRKADRS